MWRLRHWAFWFWLLFSLALLSVLAVSGYSQETGSQTTPTPMQSEKPNERGSLLRLRGIFEQQVSLLAEQSRHIETLKTSMTNSQNELASSRRHYESEIDVLNDILTQQQRALEESARSMQDSQTSQRKAVESWTTYLETTEQQIVEIQEERDKEAKRARRRGIAFLVAVGIAVGAILIAQ